MIASVKTYARARMRALGYKEWADGFNFENIPATLLDNAFHVELGVVTGVSNNHDHQTMEVPFTVRIFRAAGIDPKTLIDNGVARGDAIIADVVKASNRLTQSGLKNVRFDQLSVEPLNNSNDNGVIIRVQFSALVIISTI